MKWIFTLLVISLSTWGMAQNTTIVEGKVVDSKTGDALIGATIFISDGQTTTSDQQGRFSMSIIRENTPVTVSYIGYTTKVTNYTGDLNSPLSTLWIVKLEPSVSILDQVVITGSQNEKALVDEPVTIDVIKPDFIKKNNITSLSEAVERVPGVQMVDDQVNIRSSGFSYGAGSRVGVVVDGLPFLGGLASDIKWNFVPFENAERIEVMKGASSVLYGSSAMNGVINVITAWPTSDPYTNITFYSGSVETPPSLYRKWWNNENRPRTRGLLFSFRGKGDKLDIVLGGNYHKRHEHLENLEETRARFNFKTRYRLTDRINFGINGNMMQHDYAGFLMWMDADTNSLRHIGPFTPNQYMTFSIDPHLTIFDQNDNKHTIRLRYFNAILQRQAGYPNAPGYLLNGEYLFKRTFNERVRFTAGASHQYYYGEDPTFDIDTSQEILQAEANISAIFSQVDMDFYENKLNVIAGLRGEYVSTGEGAFNKIIPVARLSAVYKPDDHNRFRFNTGQGYRIPSLVERFAETVLFETGISAFPTISLIPNPTILPEVGWSLELGYKRLFKNDYLDGYVDLALFSMDYWNLTEVLFDYYGVPNTALDFNLLGFKTQNISRGRIAGFEAGTYTNGKIGSVPYRIWGGYTYTYPGDLDSIKSKNQNYFQNLAKAFVNVDEELQQTILKYRSLHTARFDLEITPIKDISLGFAAIYNGYMWQIDDIFIGKGTYGSIIEVLNGGELIPGFKDFRETSKGGDWVFDTRVAFNIGEHIQLNFVVNNLLNREYALRPGRMNPLRSYNVKCQLMF